MDTDKFKKAEELHKRIKSHKAITTDIAETIKSVRSKERQWPQRITFYADCEADLIELNFFLDRRLATLKQSFSEL